MAGEGVPERVEAVLCHLALASRNGNRRRYADPADHPQHVEIDQIVADVFAGFVEVVVAFRRLRTDIIVALPLAGLQQHGKQLVRNRNRDFLAGFELFNPDSSPFEVDASPLQQDTVFEPLTGVHAEMVDHSDFGFVHHAVLRIVKDFEKLPLLLPVEGKAADPETLFFTLPAKKNRSERVFRVPKFAQGGEDFAEPFDFAVVSTDGDAGTFQILSEFFGVLAADLADFHLRIADEADEFQGWYDTESVR